MDDLAAYNALLKLLDFTLLQNHLTAFSMQNRLIAIAQKRDIYLYNAKTKKQLITIKTEEGEITGIYFLPHSSHILTTTSNARVMLYNYKDPRHSVRLYSWIKKYKTQLPLRISAIAFNKNLLAIGTADGKITLVSLHSYAKVDTLQLTNAAISTLSFGQKNSLVTVDAHGEIFVYDLERLQNTKSITTHLTQTKQLLHIAKTPFFLLHSQKNSLALFDAKACKIIRSHYMKFHADIAYLQLSQERNLLVVLQNREIIHVTLQNSKNLQSLRLHNMIEEAYALVEQNPQLLDTKEYKELEKIYTIRYLNAAHALQTKQDEKAHQLLESFSKISAKQEDIKLLFEAYRHYERFAALCMQKLYAPAYAMSNKYPPLQYTKEYKKMESAYKKAYTKAQKWVILAQEDKAKALLQPYLGVIAKKEGINLILKHNQDFLTFLDALKHNNYTLIKTLLLKHPAFANIPPYKAFHDSLYHTLNGINKLLNAAKITAAKEQIKSLQNISLIENELLRLEEKAAHITQMLHAYEKSHFQACYALLDAHPEAFYELKLAKMLEKHWEKLMQKCEKYALSGQVKGIKATLKKLLTLKSRAKRVGALLRTAFLVKIDNDIAQQQYQSAENFIYSYIDIFGTDTNLQHIMRSYEKKSSHKLAIVQKPKVARDAWLHNTYFTA
jgi:hypothetical protein